MEDKVDMERIFARAAIKARGMVARKILTDMETAQLLGLFQQATVGDGNNWKLLNDPKFFVSNDGLSKHFTWLPLRGMSQREAMERYVDLVGDLMKKHCVVFPPSRVGSSASIFSSATCDTYVP